MASKFYKVKQNNIMASLHMQLVAFLFQYLNIWLFFHHLVAFHIASHLMMKMKITK